ncbi:hypothetical protein AB0M46_08720 [Dactylosporangium sp. NPDC051485]|uniref:hypothetical protein n=1 Tax=Dactylosporangium sp. NPDC051485 TaxID=3154846 RepID=UPI00341BB74C
MRLVVVVVLLLAAAAGTVFWLARPGDGPVTIDGYRRPGSDDRRLTVRFTLGVGDTITLARFEERPDAVVVAVRTRAPSGNGPDIGLPYELTATLYAPLGARRVVDARTGNPLPELTP